MTLKLTLDSLDDIDEAIKPLYVEDNGKFKLAVEGIEDTASLKGALAKERKRADENEKQVKRWQRLGKSDEEIEALISAQEEHAQSEAERKGEWEKLRAQMNEKHAADIKALNDKLAAKDKAIERYLIDSQATAAIAGAKGVPDLLLPHVQRHVRVVEENGEFQVRVVDAKGDPRVNGKGDPLSIPELVAEMKSTEIFGRAFEGSGQSGGGMPPANGGGGNPQVKRRSEFKNERERAAFVDAHGVDAYNALPI